jgi:phospholipase/carboxylesterase
MRIDPDVVLWSAPERERAGRPLLVLLHGYGSHEGDLFGLSPRLPLGPVIASVRAPLPENGGNAWFTLRGSTPGDPPKANLDYTSVGLLGFSQGAAVALQSLRQAPDRFAAVVALSGFIASGGHPGDSALATAKPPVFYGRGTVDTIIAADAVERTEAWVPGHTTDTSRIYEDLAHSISADELSDVAAFLGEHFR